MSHWFFPWSSSIKKRACRYLLQHYLGHFLEERLGLEQLSLDLYAGAGRLTRLHLDVWSVNEFLESVGAPLEILDGFIDSISVTIPWSALVTENCTVEVSGLQVTCQAGSESQSWASCMTTSMQLAQECLKEQTEEPSDASQPLEGLEMFAQTIETVLRRIEVTFLDTVIRVEHTPRSREAPGVALEIHIKRLDYCDEVVRDPGQALAVDIHQPPPFEAEPCDSGGEEAGSSPLLQIGSCSGYTEMRIKLKQNEAFPGAKEQLSKNRPLDSEDLKLIEQDLSQQLHSGLGSAPAHLEGLVAGVENGATSRIWIHRSTVTLAQLPCSLQPSPRGLTGAAVQLTCERKASKQLRGLNWDASFGLLEILDCWSFPPRDPFPTARRLSPAHGSGPSTWRSCRPPSWLSSSRKWTWAPWIASAPSCSPPWCHPGRVATLPKNPWLILTFCPVPTDAPWDLVLAAAEDVELSTVESPCELKQPEPSPFSSKRTMYETEEMVIPGDPEEMAEFQTETLAASRHTLELTFPTVHIFLPSKKINNDLLMWEPFSPLLSPTDPPGGPRSASPFAPDGTPPAHWPESFQMCKSAFKLDSDSEDDDSHFYSADKMDAQQKIGEPRNPFPLSCISVVLRVGQGRITALCDAKGEGDKLETAHGELVLDVENGSLFSDYLTAEHLEIPNFLPPDGLHPTIYASQEGPISWPLGPKKDGPFKMLSVAIQINLDMEKNIKEFLVTLRLEGATIRHRMALTHQSWYTQLIDFLDVLDDPILGFVPPAIITVLHTHLFNCAVDYRFILDNSTLFLSNKCEAETGDLNKDYVCVVEVDLLELVITTWKGATTGKLSRPLFELRCSNNVVHIHTCADSCAALANLIQYVVNKGDQHPPPRHDSPTEIAGQKVQTAAINQGDLTDALMDAERGYQEMTGDCGMRRQPSPVSVYLFPGENGAAGQEKPPPPPGTPVGEGLDFSPSEDSEGESEATDGFCILDAPGTGIPPRDGEPVVTKLLDGPVHIQEGHFSRPLGSTDLLRAPSHFPVPESRVVMREISVVWHLYGGRDFGPGRSPSGHMHSPRTKSSLPSTRSSPSRSSVPSRPQSSWRAQGGPGRIHDLLMEIQLTKVSFQHESYSGGASEKLSLESEEQPLARQVFVVQELEIRDRLASSQINKFLYLYSSELLPRRAHSNMVRPGSPVEAGAFSEGHCPFLFLLLKTFRFSSQKLLHL
ncbi:hypothetical protein E2320_013678 [Naja naja]|nr:hypothetical protein E2320_013678 [Naja naja]